MIDDHFGKIGILSEKTITGMNAVSSGDFSGSEDCSLVEIGLTGSWRAIQTLASASLVCMASESAVEWTATVSIPISRQARMIRRAISPRLAIRTLLIMRKMPWLQRSIDDQQKFVKLDRITIGDHDRRDAPASLGALIGFMTFIASTIRSVWPSLDLAAHRYKRLGTRFRRQIGRAHHRRAHGAGMIGIGDGWSAAAGAGSSWLRNRLRRQGNSGLHRRIRGDRGRLLGDTNPRLAFAEFDLCQVLSVAGVRQAFQ